MDLSRFLQAARQGCVDPFGASRYWKDSPSPSPAPDYVGAAQATAQGNLQQAQQATVANRVNQYTPYGSLTYSQPSDPSQPWSSQVNLSPTGQSLLDSLNQSQLGIAGLQNGATQGVANTMGNGFNFNGPGVQGSVGMPGAMTGFGGYSPVPTVDPTARTNAENAAYTAATSRLDPQWNTQQDRTQTQLMNQGLVPGGEAYDNAMRDFNFAKNDAYSNARNQAVQQGLAAQQAQFGMGLAANQAGYGQALGQGQFANAGLQQMFGQGLAAGQFGNAASGQSLAQQMELYNQPLNQLNALRSASQVTNPQFGSYAQQQTVPGANYSGAAGQVGAYGQNVYNQGVGQQNAMTGGLFQLGAAGLGAYPF